MVTKYPHAGASLMAAAAVHAITEDFLRQTRLPTSFTAVVTTEPTLAYHATGRCAWLVCTIAHELMIEIALMIIGGMRTDILFENVFMFQPAADFRDASRSFTSDGIDALRERVFDILRGMFPDV